MKKRKIENVKNFLFSCKYTTFESLLLKSFGPRIIKFEGAFVIYIDMYRKNLIEL
jgi:hypothetical protein